MTVLGRGVLCELLGRKAKRFRNPTIIECGYDEPVTSPPPRPTHNLSVDQSCCFPFLACVAFSLLVMCVLAITVGFIIFSATHENQPRYKGYCAIPIDGTKDVHQQAVSLSHMPLEWTTEPEVIALTTVDEQNSRDPVYNLIERFDIEENVEKISVFNNGHLIEFIHDFNVNATGIVDMKRCFIMELDPSVALRPGAFVFSIERGDEFDVTRVRSELRALIPPTNYLPDISSVFAEKCNDKPTYELKKGTETIRKRSADKKSDHDFEFFAGKNIQEISIANLQELLKYEKKLPG